LLRLDGVEFQKTDKSFILCGIKENTAVESLQNGIYGVSDGNWNRTPVMVFSGRLCFSAPSFLG